MDEFLRDLMAHSEWANAVFFHAWEKSPARDHEEMRTSHADLNNFTATLDSETLSRTLRIPWFPDPPCVITLAQALVQVAMHTQHHRGQCMTRLKDFGGKPKNIDWIIWLWQQKPRARWA